MATTTVSIEQIHDVAPFRGLSKRALRAVMSAGTVTTHTPGHAVMVEGAQPMGFHLILDGRAVVERAGKEQDELGPGDSFGVVSLIDGLPREATVRAVTELRTFALAPWQFRPLLKAEPTIALELLAGLAEMIRELQRGSVVACC